MSVRLSHCLLAVHDVDEALRFYRDVLGFEVRAETGPGGDRRVGVGPPSQPDLRIVLEAACPLGTTEAETRVIGALMADGLLGRLTFATDDCDAAFERLAAAGAEVMQEPISRAEGVRDCVFRDPSGNMLRFTQTSTG